MAELRTIEKSLDIEILSVSGSILSLPDDYIIIPHLLYNSRKFHDYVVTIVGPNGFFLISYQAFFDSQFKNENIEDAIIYLREYTLKLSDYFRMRNIKLDVPPKLLIAVDDNTIELQSDPDDVMIVNVDKIKTLITAFQKKIPYSKSKISEIVFLIRANGILTRVNQYQLLNKLEYNIDYSTYLAYDTIMDRTVLVKEIQNYTDSSKIEDLEKNEVLREARLTMQLKHENIISIEQIIPRDNSLYIIIEWVEGAKNLRQLINSNKQGLVPELALSIINQICSALEHCHAKGVVHRNIRPENILITPEYKIKITNFDLAKKQGLATMQTSTLRQISKENPYASPELRLTAGIHNVDNRVDIYSVGVILYELLTNRLPYHLDEKYWAPPSTFNHEVHKDLDAICVKALKFDQHQRFGTITAMREKIQNIGKPVDELSTEQRYIEREIYKRTKNSMIYQAFDNKTNKKVALKKLTFDSLLNSSQRLNKLQKLLSEANILKMLDHKNIVTVYDCFIEDGDGYIVMEWLEGKNLRELRNEANQFSLEEIINIGIQIAKALDYAHHQNIMHKDIKPENIIYYDKKITLLDFGLAGFLEEKTDMKSHGTAMYMAPEQLKGEIILDQRVDIFSLGVLLYELITSKYPYAPDIIMNNYVDDRGVDSIFPSELNFACPASSDTCIKKVMKTCPVFPTESSFTCPASLDFCIKKAIKIDPDERYQRINDFVSDLENIIHKNDKLSKKYYADFISIISLPKIVIFFIMMSMIVFSGIKMIQKEKKEFLEIPNVIISVPAIPVSFSFDKKAITSYDWVSDRSRRKDVVIDLKIKTNSNLNQSLVIMNVNNSSQDELTFFNSTDSLKLVKIIDNLNNRYDSKILLNTVSSDLTRVYPKTNVSGSFVIDTIPTEKAQKIDAEICENQGKNRCFFVTFEKN